ncbi:MAG: hypothetical protein UY50_C0024G0039 [Parcubacteria group bacterium GW2011_GWA2_49_9]|nr:MAG: hypothetical protein UY50_C0024G0039 [Parcubacteria group bacterium GW2011_GWA2_49_9]
MNEDIRGRYNNLNWANLLRTDLGNAGQLTAAKPILDRIKETLDFFLDGTLLNSLSETAVQEIGYQFSGFLELAEKRILQFSDVSQREQMIQTIKSQEWNMMNVLSKYLQYLKWDKRAQGSQESIVTTQIANIRKEWEDKKVEIKALQNEIPKVLGEIEKAQVFANALLKDKVSVEGAINQTKEFLNKNEEAIQSILRLNATDAAKKAKEHETFVQEFVPVWFFKKWPLRNIPLLQKVTQLSWSGSFLWLLASVFFGLIVMTIVGYFIFTGANFTIGNSLLRIASLLVPGYFTVFCAQQYLNHRRLYESYRFKDISFQTMINLRRLLPEHSRQQEQTLEKALNVLFAEPALKDSIQYDKQLLFELLRMVRKDI